MATETPFILASASPRRLSLLDQIGVKPDLVLPADIDESVLKDELPKAYALRVATAKLEAVRGDHPDAIILAADTVVAVGRRILPKTEEEGEARRCLGLLPGRRHKVLGAVAFARPGKTISTKLITTVVKFKRLHPSEIDDYIASQEWHGKAGGYAIQGMAGAFIERLVGSYTNVVGLPLTEVIKMLRGEGYPVTYHWMKRAGQDLE